MLRELPEADRRRVMVWVWHQLAAMFAQWAEKYGGVNDQTIAAWQGALGSVTVGELIDGVKRISAEDRAFLPNFGEFRAACVAGRPSGGPTWTHDADEAARDRARGGNPVAGVLEQLGKGGLTDIARREIQRMERIWNDEDVESKEESWNKLELNRSRGAL